MADEYVRALSILEKAPTTTEVVTEQSAAAFLEKFAKLIEIAGTERH
jgi:hypothetical protein